MALFLLNDNVTVVLLHEWEPLPPQGLPFLDLISAAILSINRCVNLLYMLSLLQNLVRMFLVTIRHQLSEAPVQIEVRAKPQQISQDEDYGKDKSAVSTEKISRCPSTRTCPVYDL